MDQKAGKLATVIFHPLLMPVFGIIALMYSGTYLSFLPADAKRIISLIVIIGMFLLPLSLFPFYLYRRMVTNIEFSKRKERFLPLFITSLLYCLTYYILGRLHVSSLVLTMIAAATGSLFLLMVITLWYHISLHAAGMAGLFGFILSVSIRYGLAAPIIIYGAAIASGLVGTVRLRQGAHAPGEVYSGYLVGFAFSFICGLYFSVH